MERDHAWWKRASSCVDGSLSRRARANVISIRNPVFIGVALAGLRSRLARVLSLITGLVPGAWLCSLAADAVETTFGAVAKEAVVTIGILRTWSRCTATGEDDEDGDAEGRGEWTDTDTACHGFNLPL